MEGLIQSDFGNAGVAFREAGDGHANNSRLLKDFRLHHRQATVIGPGGLGAITAYDENAVDSRVAHETRRELLKLSGTLDVTRANMGYRYQICAPQPRRRLD